MDVKRTSIEIIVQLTVDAHAFFLDLGAVQLSSGTIMDLSVPTYGGVLQCGPPPSDVCWLTKAPVTSSL